MKKLVSLLLAMAMAASLAACGQKEEPAQEEAPEGEAVELTVFAAASMTETLDEIITLYQSVAPQVTIVPSYASSGDLLKQIQEGAVCDLFISAAPKQMDTLEEEGGVLDGTRRDLLENKVTLAVPEGNPAGIESYDDMAQALKDGAILLAMGNSDVPVGQYTQKILAYYDLDETALAGAGAITYCTNVKEVTTQVSEGSVDCGVIYCTDAFSAGLTPVAYATAEMCGQVIYPAAVLSVSQHPTEAQAFLDYLSTPEAMAVFEAVGFAAA